MVSVTSRNLIDICCILQFILRCNAWRLNIRPHDAFRPRSRPAGGTAAAASKLASIPLGEIDNSTESKTVLLKDNICHEGVDMRCSSAILDGYRATVTAPAAARLLEGSPPHYAVLKSRGNMDEFAMGSLTHNSVYGPARNPWHSGHSAGGSSGGCAAAVASGQVSVALGSDTGGSVRVPAAWCGCVGLRPSRGRISRSGLAAYASSMDTIGILASSVEEVEATYNIIQGASQDDLTTLIHESKAKQSIWGSLSSSKVARSYTPMAGLPLRGLRVGVARESFSAIVNPSVRDAVQLSVKLLCALGATVQEFNLFGSDDAKDPIPTRDEVVASYYTIAAAEAASNLARFDGVRYGKSISPSECESSKYHSSSSSSEWMQDFVVQARTQGFSDTVSERILLGSEVLRRSGRNRSGDAALYSDAVAVRRALTARCQALLPPPSSPRPSSIVRRMASHILEAPSRLLNWMMRQARRVFKTDAAAPDFRAFDVILCPTAPDAAPRLPEGATTEDQMVNRTIAELYSDDIFTVFASLADLPALSVPAGFKTIPNPDLPGEYSPLCATASGGNITTPTQGTHLPVGVQLVAGRFQEKLLFDIGAALSNALRSRGPLFARYDLT